MRLNKQQGGMQMLGYMDKDELIIELLKAILSKLDDIDSTLNSIDFNTSL